MTAEQRLEALLAPGETVLWSAGQSRRRPSPATLLGRALLLLVLAAALGAVVTLLWNLVTDPTTPAGPFRGFGGRWPIAFGACLVLLLMALGRRFVSGTPERLLAVTDTRALVIEMGRDGPRILDEQPRDALTHLTRVIDRGRTDLLWRVSITHSRGSSAGSGNKTYHRHGLLGLTDPVPAEAALLDPHQLAEAPDAGAPVHRAPAAEQQLIGEVLLPGERVIWCEAARASEVQRSRAPFILLGIGVLLLVGFFGLGLALVRATGREEGLPLPLLVIGVVFAVVLALISAALWRDLRLRALDDAVYAVTGIRALSAMRARDGTLLVNSFLPSAVVGKERPAAGVEGWDFVFGAQTPLPLKFLIEQDGFHRVRDVEGASAALLRLTDRR